MAYDAEAADFGSQFAGLFGGTSGLPSPNAVYGEKVGGLPVPQHRQGAKPGLPTPGGSPMPGKAPHRKGKSAAGGLPPPVPKDAKQRLPPPTSNLPPPTRDPDATGDSNRKKSRSRASSAAASEPSDSSKSKKDKKDKKDKKEKDKKDKKSRFWKKKSKDKKEKKPKKDDKHKKKDKKKIFGRGKASKSLSDDDHEEQVERPKPPPSLSAQSQAGQKPKLGLPPPNPHQTTASGLPQPMGRLPPPVGGAGGPRLPPPVPTDALPPATLEEDTDSRFHMPPPFVPQSSGPEEEEVAQPKPRGLPMPGMGIPMPGMGMGLPPRTGGMPRPKGGLPMPGMGLPMPGMGGLPPPKPRQSNSSERSPDVEEDEVPSISATKKAIASQLAAHVIQSRNPVYPSSPHPSGRTVGSDDEHDIQLHPAGRNNEKRRSVADAAAHFSKASSEKQSESPKHKRKLTGLDGNNVSAFAAMLQEGGEKQTAEEDEDEGSEKKPGHKRRLTGFGEKKGIGDILAGLAAKPDVQKEPGKREVRKISVKSDFAASLGARISVSPMMGMGLSAGAMTVADIKARIKKQNAPKEEEEEADKIAEIAEDDTAKGENEENEENDESDENDENDGDEENDVNVIPIAKLTEEDMVDSEADTDEESEQTDEMPPELDMSMLIDRSRDNADTLDHANLTRPSLPSRRHTASKRRKRAAVDKGKFPDLEFEFEIKKPEEEIEQKHELEHITLARPSGPPRRKTAAKRRRRAAIAKREFPDLEFKVDLTPKATFEAESVELDHVQLARPSGPAGRKRAGTKHRRRQAKSAFSEIPPGLEDLIGDATTKPEGEPSDELPDVEDKSDQQKSSEEPREEKSAPDKQLHSKPKSKGRKKKKKHRTAPRPPSSPYPGDTPQDDAEDSTSTKDGDDSTADADPKPEKKSARRKSRKSRSKPRPPCSPYPVNESDKPEASDADDGKPPPISSPAPIPDPDSDDEPPPPITSRAPELSDGDDDVAPPPPVSSSPPTLEEHDAPKLPATLPKPKGRKSKSRAESPKSDHSDRDDDEQDSQDYEGVVEDDEYVPDGWLKYLTDQGDPYYYHEDTEEVRWTNPALDEDASDIDEGQVKELEADISEAFQGGHLDDIDTLLDEPSATHIDYTSKNIIDLVTKAANDGRPDIVEKILKNACSKHTKLSSENKKLQQENERLLEELNQLKNA